MKYFFYDFMPQTRRTLYLIENVNVFVDNMDDINKKREMNVKWYEAIIDNMLIRHDKIWLLMHIKA